MANKRISELVQITAPDVSTDDLLLLADITAHESKKLRLGDLNTFLSRTANSGSFFGTSSWAQCAAYALGGPIPSTASYSFVSALAYNAISAINAISASYALSGSYTITASYALSTPLQTVFSAAFSDYARTASYLLYTPGLANGTASFALTSSMTLGTASYSYTASHAGVALYAVSAGGVGGSVPYALSASWASSSYQSTWATQSFTASFLQYSGNPNGTASYAMVAGGFPEVRIDYGVHQAITQSAFFAQIDKVFINPSIAGYRSSSFEAVGTVIVPFTSSVFQTCSIELIALNRWSGITSSLDKAPLNIILPINSGTGSIAMPYSLMGEAPLSGSIMVYVTASNGAILSPTRPVRFKVTSLANSVVVSTAETMSLMVIPFSGAPPTFTYTSSGFLFSGTDADVATVANTVTEINVSNLTLSSIKYLWTLPRLKKLNATDNYAMVDIGGMPNSIETMSLSNCLLNTMAPLIYTSASIFDCSNNQLRELPPLPSTMSYIDCSGNASMTLLPDPLPRGLEVIYADGTSIPYPPTSIPNTLITMSMAGISALNTWTTSFPTAMTYFDCHNTNLTSLPTLPSGVLYLDAQSCQLTTLGIDNITTQLVSNGLSNGYLGILGNTLPYSAGTLSRITTLQSRGWTIVS
jgi:hypothetical protein